jgi:glyoxylase-like metal-dependent hydrolase (beta-lactamase superfamily II)
MSPIRRLADDIWVTEVALDEYNVRGVLVVGDQRALVWDTLSHPRDMTGYRPLIGDRELLVVYSHADWDHIWGTAGLPHASSVIVGHSLCRTRFGDDVPVTLRERRLAEPGTWDGVALVAPNTAFDNEMVLSLGAMTIRLRHLPGHTPDSIVGFIPARGLLLMGDAAETPFPVVPAGSPLERWIAELERWERDPRVRTVVPAHGALGGPEILARNIDYLTRLRDGHRIEVVEPLTDFYRKTHESNLRAVDGND